MHGVSVPDGRILTALAGFSTAHSSRHSALQKNQRESKLASVEGSPLIRREAKLEDGLSEVSSSGSLALFLSFCGFRKD
jgi:hypothetical protein